MTEREETREQLLAQALKIKEQMKGLLDNVYFKEYVKALQVQYDERMRILIIMPEGADDVVKRTYTTGELAGLKLAIDLPNVMMETAQNSIDYNSKLQELDYGQGTKQNYDEPAELDDGYGNYSDA